MRPDLWRGRRPFATLMSQESRVLVRCKKAQIGPGTNVYGGAVNIAARTAAAGKTLVSGTVRELARTSARVACCLVRQELRAVMRSGPINASAPKASGRFKPARQAGFVISRGQPHMRRGTMSSEAATVESPRPGRGSSSLMSREWLWRPRGADGLSHLSRQLRPPDMRPL